MGILDDFVGFIKTPEGQGVASAIAGGMAGARRNAPLNTLGAAGMSGLLGYSGAQDRQEKQSDQLIARQMHEMQYNALKQKMDYERQNQALIMGGGPSSASSALQSGADVGDIGPTVTNAERMQAMPQPTNAFGAIPKEIRAAWMLSGKPEEAAKAAWERSKPDMQVANGYAYDKNKLQSGFLPGVHVSNNGQATVQGVGPDGTPVIYAPPGALNTYAQYQLAEQRSKAGFQPQEITNPDGSKTLSTVGRVVDRINGTDPSFPRVTPAQQVARDGDRKEIVRQELVANPNDPALRKEASSLGIPLQSESQKIVAKGNAENDVKNNSMSSSSKRLLPMLEEANTYLDKSTGSLGGTIRDTAQSLIGKSGEPAQYAAKLKALEGQVMLAQPRMEGPQSDKDAALYRQMAGLIGESTVPAATRRSALDTVYRLHQRYSGVQETGLPALGKNADVRSAADAILAGGKK